MAGRRSMMYVSLGSFVCMWCAVMWTTSFASALPGDRHYEMVSEPYKGGYGVNAIIGAAMARGAGEGESAGYESYGALPAADNTFVFIDYLARRTSVGWSTETISVPATRWQEETRLDIAPTLSASLYRGNTGPSRGAAHYEGAPDFVLQDMSRPAALTYFGATPLKRLDGEPLKINDTNVTASRDFCHVIFTPVLYELPGASLLEEARGTQSNLYELTIGTPPCGNVEALRLLAVSNKIGPHGEPEALDPYCPAFSGSIPEAGGSGFRSVSADGTEAFFETSLNLSVPGCDTPLRMAPQDPAVLFVRVGHQKTVEVSTPIVADCGQGAPCYRAIEEGAMFKAFTGQQRAVFDGASEDGSRVFFTTVQPLVTDDSEVACEERPGGIYEFETRADCESGERKTEKGKWKRFGNDVYMAEIGCPQGRESCVSSEKEVTSLVQVSHDEHAGEAAEVQNVAISSPDGTRVYYVAQGVLTEEAGPEGSHAAKGADNLYVYDSKTGATKFIGDLCSGSGRSGGIEDQRCPSNPDATDAPLWGNFREVQTAGTDGRFLVFNTYARLASSDTDTTKDVYLYDASTGGLDLVSIGEGGYHANGNDDELGVELPPLAREGKMAEDFELNYRAISEDGSRVVFETSQPLSPSAVNGLTNIYEWHDGRVALLSSGDSAEAVGQRETVMMTPSGRDVFFVTDESLVGQDTDEARDLYDAREGEGFPQSSVQRQSCSGEACQGALTSPAPLLVPGSVSQTPGENVAPLRGKARAKPKHKSKRASGRRKGRKHKPGDRATRAGHRPQ